MASNTPLLNHPRLRHPLVLTIFSLLISLGAALLVSFVILNLPWQDIQQMVFLMASTGITTTVTSYILFRTGILQWLGGIRWVLMLIILFTIAVIIINMWLLAQVMFIDSHYMTMVSSMLFFAGLTAISFAFFVSKAMTDRLHNLTNAAEHLAGGHLDTRCHVQGNDEIAQLTQTFNSMAQSLQEVDEEKRALEKTRRDLIAWVSHDLRTPLASMRVMMEALADGIITDEETTNRYLHSSLAEIEHLSHLIDDLFEMAKLDVGHHNMQFQPTSLHDLVSDTLGGMMAKAQAKHIMLKGHVAPDVDLVTIAPDKIQRVLHNLINNAITYTPAGETVTITVHRHHNQAGEVQVNVHNTGVHIADDVLPKLFNSFYRGEQSRAVQDGARGTGLGLAIARGFVEAHGGRIWAESNAQTGTTFRFTLPNPTHATQGKRT